MYARFPDMMLAHAVDAQAPSLSLMVFRLARQVGANTARSVPLLSGFYIMSPMSLRTLRVILDVRSA